MGWFSTKKDRPDATDVAIRAIILRHLVSYTFLTIDWITRYENWGDADKKKQYVADFAVDRDQHWSQLGSWKKHLLPSESEYARTALDSISDMQQVNGSWRAEALGTLLWGLGVINEIPAYDVQISPDDCGDFLSVDADTLIKQAKLRPKVEIDRASDIAELWHWRSRTRQLIEEGNPFPSSPEMEAAGFSSYDQIVRMTAGHAAKEGKISHVLEEDFPVHDKPYRELSDDEWSAVRSITVERHYALNWLCGYAPKHNWDETPTDT